MKLLHTLSFLASAACLSLGAKDLPASRLQLEAPKSAPAPAAPACNEKGCPEQDEHGHSPVSCEFKDGIATGFRCILMCSYEDSKWGSIVASFNCK